jgi:hypothetical protein
MAVPVVLGALLAAFALGTTAVISTVGAQQGVTRDQDTKAALAAAEAGVSEALLHYNRAPTPPSTPCLVGTPLTTAAPGASGWCEGVSRAVSGLTGATYTYWVRPTNGEVEIVSQGNVDGVTRQVDVVARSSANRQPFGDADVIGLNFLDLEANSTITANVATNGNITMESNSTLVCNYVEVGPGHNVIQDANAHYTCPAPVFDTTSLPPVNQGDVATNNSNGRFFSNLGANPGDLISGSNGPACPSGYIGTKRVCWNNATRHLWLKGGGVNPSLTIAGTNYSLCTLTMESNSKLYIAAGSTVNLYFDSPESCGLGEGAVQLQMDSNTRIAANNGGPTNLAMLFVGSDTINTSATLASNTEQNAACQQDFIVYAPRTDFTLASNSYYCGAIAAKSIHLSSEADIRTSVLGSEYALPNVADHFVAEEFVECSSTATSPPDAGC